MLMFVAVEPKCKTNLSSADHSVNEFDFILVECQVRYRGNWAPVIRCHPGAPGVTNTTDTHVTYKQVIPASPQINGQTVLCTTLFTAPAPSLPSPNGEPPNNSYTWTSPTIRVIRSKTWPTGTSHRRHHRHHHNQHFICIK